jgi:hypothetical protein
MEGEGWAARWRQLSEGVSTAMHDSRAAHPHPTLAEIEAEVKVQLSRLHARMLEEAAPARACPANRREHYRLRRPQAGEHNILWSGAFTGQPLGRRRRCPVPPRPTGQCARIVGSRCNHAAVGHAGSPCGPTRSPTRPPLRDLPVLWDLAFSAGDALQLPAGTCSPYLRVNSSRLATWLPFEQVAAGLA